MGTSLFGEFDLQLRSRKVLLGVVNRGRSDRGRSDRGRSERRMGRPGTAARTGVIDKRCRRDLAVYGLPRTDLAGFGVGNNSPVLGVATILRACEWR